MTRISGKILIGIIILTLIAVIAGCGEEETTTSASDTKAKDSQDKTSARTGTTATTVGGVATAPGTAGATMEVKISGFKFQPAELTIPAGTTIKWTNEDSAPHTATANDKAFDSGNLAQGDSFEFTFSAPGSFPYVCTYHPQMVGTITVE